MRSSLVVLLSLLLAACAAPGPQAPVAADQLTPFSAGKPGAAAPRGWEPWLITRAKTPTDYQLVLDAERGGPVLHAVAERAASGLAHRVEVDPAQRPLLAWDWRVPRLIPTADNTDPHAEDSPVRLMLFFDGDKSSLPFKEQMLMETAQMLTGRELPYATLMYVWENRQPVGTVIANQHSGQVKMVVAASGAAGLGEWLSMERDYVADYRRAFGAEPGRLVGVGVLTDTDNTGARAEAWYGDIQLRPRPQTAAR